MHLLVFGTNPCAPVRKIEIYYHTACMYASIVYTLYLVIVIILLFTRKHVVKLESYKLL